MADANYHDFDKRMRRILRNHERLSHGHVTTVTRSGLIVARPRRRVFAWVPWRLILALLIIGMVAKVALYINLGPEAYGARVAELAQGTEVEQAGAYLMTADQATIWIAGKVQEYLPN